MTIDPELFRVGRGRATRWGYRDNLPCDEIKTDPAEIVVPAWSTMKKVWPNGAIPMWNDGLAAEYCVDHPDVFTLDRADAIRRVRNSVRHISEASQNRGTAVHAIMEGVAAGQPIGMFLEPDVIPYEAAMRAFLDEVQPEFLLSEYVGFNATIGYGLTGDVIMRIPGIGVVVADYKTRAHKDDGRDDVCYAEESLQVTAARHCSYVFAEDADGQPKRFVLDELVGRIDYGMVIVLMTGGRYSCHLVDVNDPTALVNVANLRAMWETVDNAAQALISRWSPPPREITAAPAAEDLYREWTVARIAAFGGNAEAIGALVNNWDRFCAGIPKLKESATHTQEQLDAINGLLAKIEAKFGLPFFDPLPEPPDPFDGLPSTPAVGVRANETPIAETPSPQSLADEAKWLIAEQTDGEADMVRVVAEAAMVDGYALMNERSLERIRAVCAAVAHETLLNITMRPDGRYEIVPNPACEAVVVARRGSKTHTTTAAKRWIKNHALPVTARTFAEVMANPTLVALVLYGDGTAETQAVGTDAAINKGDTQQ